MNNLVNHDIEISILWFEEYCFEEKGLDERTTNRYISIIENYLKETIRGDIDLSSPELFTTEKITEFRQILTSKMVRSALNAFNNFLFDRGFIDESLNQLTFKKAINSAFSKTSDGINDREDKNIFLSPNDIRTLFSDSISYKSDEERFVFPLIVALSYFCLFNQKDIELLRLTDVDLKNKTIRNSRAKPSEDTVSYIQMNDSLFKIFRIYIDYRNKLHTLSGHKDSLVIVKGKTIENGTFGQIYNVINSASKNRGLVKNIPLSSGSLLRSSILYSLRKSSGGAITDISKLLGKSLLQNEYFKNAFEEFHKNNMELNDSNSYEVEEIEIILPKFSKKRNLPTELNSYSEINDITIEDIEEYDMKKEITPSSTKITIQRLVRDSKIARDMKQLYKNTCQNCGHSIRKSDGSYYSEAHHIQPYNKIHRGDDVPSNILILCSNCHTQFDDSYYAIHPETKQIHCIFSDDNKHLTTLTLKHTLDKTYLEYAWKMFNHKK